MNGKWSSSKGCKAVSGKQKAEKLLSKRNDLLINSRTRNFQQDDAKELPEFRLYQTDSNSADVSLFHIREADYEVEKRMVAARNYLDRMHTNTDTYNFYKELVPLPQRPPWNERTKRHKLMKREDAYFEEYLKLLYNKYPPTRLNHFEHNIQVWRQLWRVCEKSDILLVVADVRHPLFHLPPSLYNYVVEHLNKKLIMILNKIDLVTEERLNDWKKYLSLVYPGVTIVCVTSYPYSQAHPCMPVEIDASSMKHQNFRKRKLNPYGIDQLFKVIRENCGLEAKPEDNIAIDKSNKEKEIHDSDDSDEEEEEVQTTQSFTKSNPFALLEDDDEVEVSLTVAKSKSYNIKKVEFANEDVDTKTETKITEEPAVTDEIQSTKETVEAPRKPNTRKMWWMLESVTLDDDYDKKEEYLLNGEPIPEEESEEELPPQKVVGVLGHPNAGKSSLINAITGRFCVGVSETPGKTKHLQTIVLDDELMLVDCPGLVFPAVDMPKSLQVLAAIFPLSQTREPYSSVAYLAERIPIEKIYGLKHPNSKKVVEKTAKTKKRNADEKIELDVEYDFEELKPETKVDEEWSAWMICETYAKMKKYYTQAGGLDAYQAAHEILEHAISGVIDFSSAPPKHYENVSFYK